jgi:poly(A) polymerase
MTPREFAIDVVRTLRNAGFQALWAGGCVRDELLGMAPKDYDVATTARPEQIRDLFGRKRTVPVGAAFGVIMVVGPKSAGTVEVATFRRDAGYSDGRRPDAVTFSTAEEDASRRDFTINGLFYDPLAAKVIDYVQGERDLQQKIVRAIGDPHARIAEDKLRMLRAVRFAATFQFHLDEACLDAVRQHAGEIGQVSAERISAELRLMLVHPHRGQAARLLVRAGLLPVLLPEAQAVYQWDPATGDGHPDWHFVLAALERLGPLEEAAVALAVLLRFVLAPTGTGAIQIHELRKRWRLANHEVACLRHLLEQEALILSAGNRDWPTVQRILIADYAQELLQYCQALAETSGQGAEDVVYCRTQLALPREKLDPAPLITGHDLKTLGIAPGKVYQSLLKTIRDEQLQERLSTREQALSRARELASDSEVQDGNAQDSDAQNSGPR